MVITAISLETLAAVTAYYAARNGYQLDITQVSAARSKRVGQHHLMMAQNPVYIMTAVRQDAGSLDPDCRTKVSATLQGAFAGRTPQSAMLPAPLLRGALLRTAKAGRLATAVRFGNRLAPLVGRHLTGQKGLGRPLQSDLRPAGVFAFSMNDERPTMNDFTFTKGDPHALIYTRNAGSTAAFGSSQQRQRQDDGGLRFVTGPQGPRPVAGCFQEWS